MQNIDATHPDYTKFSPVWSKVDDVITGQRAVHGKKETYLPKLVDELPTDYDARLARSNFTNFSWRTISGFQGMLFRKPPLVTVPTGIESYLADITMSGQSMETFAKAAAFEVLSFDRVGILVDYPTANVVGLSVASTEALGLRPFMTMYDAKSIINWKFKRIRNQMMLALVVLKSCASVGEDEFEHKEEDRWNVLDLDEQGFYRQRVFRKKDNAGTATDKFEQVGDDLYPLMNNAKMDFIPFFIVNGEGEATDVDDPPMVDLIDANIAYYQVNSDRRHGLHFTGLPMLFLSGVMLENGAQIRVGTQAAITSSDPNAKGTYVEFTGQGLNAIKDYQAELRQEMAVMGARMLADETKSSVETLGATEIKRTGENSILASVADSLSGALEGALTVFAQWAGQTGEISYRINKKFLPRPMTPQELTALVGGWQAGAISDSELFDNLKAGEIIADDKSLEEHQSEVDAQGPARPALAA